MATTYLSKTFGSGGTSNKIGTFSCWFKRSKLGQEQVLFSANHTDGSASRSFIRIESDDTIGARTHPTAMEMYTRRKFRDTNAWYHLVVAIDTTQSTASNRFKYYINGEQITSFSTETYPAQDKTFGFGQNVLNEIGRDSYGSSNIFDGLMSHVHWIDGTQYQASDFGETDSTTGEWKIKTNPSVTYGTNGFFILKDGNSVTDQSGNTNNFTANGNLTNTEDCPSNSFATINPLVPYSSNYDFYNGNTTVENDGSAGAWGTRWGVSTLGMNSGKYYAEAKIANIGTNQMYALGLAKDVGTFTPSSSVGSEGIGYYAQGGIFKYTTEVQTSLATYTTNDIIGIAFDRDNGTVQWYKNGSAIGNAETGLSTDGTWFFVTNFYTNGKVYVNYGNGYFGTTAVSSAGTNASNIGIFEYDVPAGYTALSTKGINSF